MAVKPNTFAEALYQTHAVEELDDLLTGPADSRDMKTWLLTPEQWRAEVKTALRALVADAEAQQAAWAAEAL